MRFGFLFTNICLFLFPHCCEPLLRDYSTSLIFVFSQCTNAQRTMPTLKRIFARLMKARLAPQIQVNPNNDYLCSCFHILILDAYTCISISTAAAIVHYFGIFCQDFR